MESALLSANGTEQLNTGRSQNRLVQAITGGLVFLISFLVYFKTVAPTTSFWDCGEFIASSKMLGVIHPPGAPLYLLFGRLAIMLPFFKDIGLRVNMFSVLVSAVTVFLTYLVIAQLIRRWRGESKNWEDRWIIYGSAAFGALAFAFTDSQWFNAVEAEVYALSMFFTALVIWLAMVWEERSERSGSMLIIFFIFYMFGLATGVHLLNILTFPFVMLIAFFHHNRTVRNLLALLFIQAVVPVGLYILIYNYNPRPVNTGIQQYQMTAKLLLILFVGIWTALTVTYVIKRDRIVFAAVCILSAIGLVILFPLVYYSGIFHKPMMQGDFLAWQAKAWNFMKIFGAIWIVVTLAAMAVIDQRAFMAWWIIPLLGIIGYSTYLVIYIRAGMHPPINENDPSTIKGMMDYLARKQYGQESMMLTLFNRQADFWKYQLNLMYIRYFSWQFIGTGTHIDYQDRIVEIVSMRGLWGIPFLVGAWGAIHHFFRDWRRALAVFVLFILTGFAIIIYLNQPDPQPRERDYSYVGSFWAFALWVGVGMAGILEWISESMKNRTALRKAVFTMVTVVLVALVPARLLAFNYHAHDRTGEYVASDYSYNILQTCEPDAIIFTNGDNDTFPLWYLQEVEGVRKDVRVVNLSLLNTSWYIYQLRDQEPRVPIHMSDKDIDRMDYMPWQASEIEIPVPQVIQELELMKYLHADPNLPDARKKYALVGKDRDLPVIKDKIVFKLDPTYPENNPIVLRVQDLMILRILYDNKWERPVYFAVTVANNNMLNMDNYLRMDGLAFKIMPYAVNDRVDADTLRKNIVDDYRYRGLNDPSVYFNTNIIKLLGNYRSAFMKLSQTYSTQGDREKAVETIRIMDEKIPPEVIPYPSELTAMYINNIAENLNMDIDIGARTKMVIPNRLMSRQERRETANFYAFGYQMYDRAEEILKALIEEDPNDMRTQSELYAVYKQSGKYQEAYEFLENWLGRNPDDPSAQREMEEVKRLLEAGPSKDSIPDMVP